MQRIGLSSQRRTPTPLMEPIPPFGGDAQTSRPAARVNRKFGNFNISRRSPSRPWTANNNRRAGRQYKRSEEPTTLFTVSRLPHHILQIPSRRTISIGPCRRSDFGRANFFHRLLRANVVFSDEEYNVLDKLERVIEQ